MSVDLDVYDAKAKVAYNKGWDKLPKQSIQFYYTPDNLICCKNYPGADSCIPVHTAEYAVEFGEVPVCQYEGHPDHT